MGKNEYRDTKELANFLGRDPRGSLNAWCARFVNKSLAENGIAGTGSDMAMSFSKWGKEVQDGTVKRGDVMFRSRGGGKGHVGMATGQTKNGMIEMIHGNSSDSVRKTWEPIGKYRMRRGEQVNPNLTSGVPTGSGLLQKVPPPSPTGTMMPVGPGMGQSGGPVAININGGSHDPESLALLVQRRINEAMNWRTHDIDHQLT
jgi:uncharacterized protein (TIGR02594 family)